LQLDDDEAVAIAIALRTATGSGNTDFGEAAGTALVKLEQVLPRRLRGRISAVRDHTQATGSSGGIDPEVLIFLTGACRDHRRVRFDYTTRESAASRREVEPHRVVQVGRRWYLIAFDPARDDWRQFRLDRMTVKRPEGAKFSPRKAPSAADVVQGIDSLFARHRAVVVVDAPAAQITAKLPPAVLVEVVDDHRCRVHATAETPSALVLNLLMLDADFVIEQSSPELDAALGTVFTRMSRCHGMNPSPNVEGHDRDHFHPVQP
jgi:predicted DNA-binding transcriptional regulator YafY